MTRETFLSEGSSLNCLTRPNNASGGAAGTLEEVNTDADGADMMWDDSDDRRCAAEDEEEEDEVGGNAEEEGGDILYGGCGVRDRYGVEYR